VRRGERGERKGEEMRGSREGEKER